MRSGVVSYFKRLFSKRERTVNAESKELLRIQKTPRFTAGGTEIFSFGKKIKYADSASFCFMYDEIFKKEIYKFRNESPSPYILDAGANIGLSAIYFKRTYPNSKIVAIEPDPTIFGILKFNMRAMGFEDIDLINKALWNKETILRFYSEGADGGRLARENDSKHIVEVRAEKLSPYLANKPIDLLKIDIEGAEYEVLEEIKDRLDNVRNIFVEYHSFVDQTQRLDGVLAMLREAGFRVIIHHVGIFSPNPFCELKKCNGMDLQLNIFGVRV